jgi:hypothetical protein
MHPEHKKFVQRDFSKPFQLSRKALLNHTFDNMHPERKTRANEIEQKMKDKTKLYH